MSGRLGLIEQTAQPLLVVDASFVLCALAESGERSEAALEALGCHKLVAPHLLPVEVASVLRKLTLRKELSEEAAAVAYTAMLGLEIDYAEYSPFAERVWELRPNVQTYDAWYVALAESISAPLATGDDRLRKATGPKCAFFP